ncbi:MAG TPA: FeoC-like transcriptional regulator [Thiobacillaceae bacterium]|nr:FeoC-like transcriptional regulator [Thiobacillaceae bacterium]HNU64715.1 FeoC-like transcriptional regulator [Thiobacillaceae bacterium]
MILSRINDYMRLHRRASVADMALGLDAAPEAVKGMLDVLERKGRVRRLPSGTACTGCCKCDPNTVELYEWVGG